MAANCLADVERERHRRFGFPILPLERHGRANGTAPGAMGEASNNSNICVATWDNVTSRGSEPSDSSPTSTPQADRGSASWHLLCALGAGVPIGSSVRHEPNIIQRPAALRTLLGVSNGSHLALQQRRPVFTVVAKLGCSASRALSWIAGHRLYRCSASAYLFALRTVDSVAGSYF